MGAPLRGLQISILASLEEYRTSKTAALSSCTHSLSHQKYSYPKVLMGMYEMYCWGW